MAASDYRDFIEVMDNTIQEDPFASLSEMRESSNEDRNLAKHVKKVFKEIDKELEDTTDVDSSFDDLVEDEVTLEVRNPMDEDDILQAVKKDRDAAVQAQATFADKIRTCYNAYHAIVDSKYNIPGRSSIVSSDVMDTIEWMMPSLMRVFTASQDIVVIQPMGGEDVTAAEQHQALINYQFNYKMEGFTKFYTWFKDALIYGFGVIKITWETMYEKKSIFYDEMTQDEFTALSIQSNVSIESYDEYEDVAVTETTGSDGSKEETVSRSTVFRNVRAFIKKNVYAGPWIENIPVSSFYIEPGARTVREANFVGHRVRRTMDYLRRMEREGIYHNVDQVIPYAEGDSEYTEMAGISELEGEYAGLNKELMPAPSEGREYKWVWECWVKLDIDGDGLLESLLVTFTDDVLLRVEENPFDHGEAPFETIVPIVDCHRLHGISITDLVMEFQRMKTSLYRNVFDNVAFSVNNFYLVARNSGTDIGALTNIKPGAIVFTEDVNQSVREMKPDSLSPSLFNLFEYLDKCKENRTGVTSYSQGMDADSLNKMLSIDTKIPMADGSYKLNGDLVDGDMVVGSNGKPTTVVKAHPIQLPERAFELTFTSGDVIKAGVEHRWRVNVVGDEKDQLEWEYLNTGQIYQLMCDGFKVYVPVMGKDSKQLIESIKEIPIEPMRCISVSAEDQCYCCGDRFTVTANTATGISAIMTASQQRIELIARLLAETGVKYAFRKMIALNQQFITDKMVLRLFNKPLEITPDKLDGSFDLMVNVGIGAGLKELQQSQMLNLLNILPSLAQLGLVKPNHVHYVVSKLLESMGYKDIENFIEMPPEGAQMPQQGQPEVSAQPMQTAQGPASPVDAPTMFM